MEILSYTSNVQPYGSQSGTKLASESNDEKRVSAQGYIERSDKTATPDDKQTHQASQADAAGKAAEKYAQERSRLSEEQRVKMVKQMQEFVSSMNRGLSFRVDEESGRDVMTVYEADTGKVIRQIPEEEMLEVWRRLAEDAGHHTGLVMTQV